MAPSQASATASQAAADLPFSEVHPKDVNDCIFVSLGRFVIHETVDSDGQPIEVLGGSGAYGKRATFSFSAIEQ